MKNRILIIEDNYYKFFTTKQLLESQLKITIEVIGVSLEGELPEAVRALAPHSIIYKPEGPVMDLLKKLQKRKVNRRNSAITLMIAAEPLPTMTSNDAKAALAA